MATHPILSALLRNKTGPILVALQVAISLAILANALHIVSLRQAVALRPTGLADESTIFRMTVRHLTPGSHNEQSARQKAETAALRAVSGVRSAAWTTQTPMAWIGSSTGVAIDPKQHNFSAFVSFYVTADSLVDTFGLKLVEGRDFKPHEIMDIDVATVERSVMPQAVIVTRALADKLWPGQASVVGKTLYFGTGADANWSRVIGVVDLLQSHAAEVDGNGYLSVISPARLTNAADSIYAVRTEPGQLDRVMREAEAAVRKTSPMGMIIRTFSAEHDRKERYRADISLAWMLVTVSVLLLLVTCSGIVGMASLWVNQRRKQIGVRRALGARRIDILRHFLAENFIINSTGVMCGTLLALALNHQLVVRLGMERLPPAYLAIGALVFLGLGAMAAYGPAWRAASISPATATRTA